MVWKQDQQPPTDMDWVLVEVGAGPCEAENVQRQPVKVFRVSANAPQSEMKKTIEQAAGWAEARSITRVYVRTEEP